MDEMTRRDAVRAAAAVSTMGLLPGTARAGDKADGTLDRQRVIECGFTEAEADCWVQVNKAAGMLLDLPKLHMMDDHELTHAIHVLQYRLMSRPFYRKYRTAPPAEQK